MGRPRILSDNVFNVRVYPGHALAASTTAVGTDVSRLASGRRRRVLSGWSASTLNAEAWIECTFDRPRAFDLVFIDRDHNLDQAGTPQVGVRISDDAFVTSQQFGAYDIPSGPTPNARLDVGTVVRTDEGALILSVGFQVARAIRVFIPAMGTGLRPELAGVALGQSWSPSHHAVKPFDYGKPVTSDSDHREPRTGLLHLKTASFAEAATGRYHVDELMLGSRRPTLIMHDDDEAERAVFVRAEAGRSGFEISGEWSYPQVRIPWMELEPEGRR